MEFKEPIRKKNSHRVDSKPPFPVIIGNNSGLLIDDTGSRIYRGYYNGNCVIISEPEEMVCLNTMGFFGKGSLSRCFPKFGKYKDGLPPIIKERQWQYRTEWMKKITNIENYENNSESSAEKGEGTCSSQQHEETKIIQVEKEVDKTLEEGNIEEKAPENPECDKILQKDKDVFVIENVKSPKKKLKRYLDETDHPEENENKKLCIYEEVENSKQTEVESLKPTEFERKIIEINIGEESNEEEMSEVLVVADSDSENEDYCGNLKPHIEREEIQSVYEELHLTLEEAFFLSFGLGCLEVIDLSGKLLSIKSMWTLYREAKKDFIEKYITYHYFRSKGWIVKCGLKFGGDYILYKKGPPFYHASYIVIIDIIDHELKRIPEKCKRRFTWSYLGAVNRLAESTHKEVILCQIKWPEAAKEDMANPYVLKKFQVNEVLLRRWQATQERDISEKNQHTSTVV